jgi:hypothetical protein
MLLDRWGSSMEENWLLSGKSNPLTFLKMRIDNFLFRFFPLNISFHNPQWMHLDKLLCQISSFSMVSDSWDVVMFMKCSLPKRLYNTLNSLEDTYCVSLRAKKSGTWEENIIQDKSSTSFPSPLSASWEEILQKQTREEWHRIQSS